MLQLTTYEVVNMELYHLLNRGVDKRKIFMEDGDRVRFVHGLFQFNRDLPANNTGWNIATHDINDLRGRYSSAERLVDLHGWVLMGNHYHLLVSERAEKGLSRFLMKLNVGYAKYFNEKYKRVGTLFQGRTKKVRIADDAHFLHILHYIHLNPLDFLAGAKDWREGRLSGAARAFEHLDAYRWSSYRDYCGARNFPSILTTDLFADVFLNYKKTINEYIRDIDIEILDGVTLE